MASPANRARGSRGNKAFNSNRPCEVEASTRADNKVCKGASVVSNPSYEIGGWMFRNQRLLAVNREEANKGTACG